MASQDSPIVSIKQSTEGAYFNPPVLSFVEKAQARFLQYTGDPALSRELAWQALANLRQQQASDLAYFDC